MRPKFVPEDIKDEEVGAFMSALVKAKKEKKNDFIYNQKKYRVTSSCEEVDESLWANIHKKRKAGKRMRKPGEKGAPTAADFKRAKGESVEEYKVPSNYAAMMAKKRKKAGTSEFSKSDSKMARQSDKQLKDLMKKMRDLEKKDPKKPSTQSMIKRIAKEMKKRKLTEQQSFKEYKILSKTPRKDASPVDKQIRAGVKFSKARIMTHKGEVELTKKEMQAWLKSYDKLLPRLQGSMNKMAIRGPEGLRLTIKAGIHDFGPAIKDYPTERKEDNNMEESTAAYAKSLEKIANDRKMKNISKKDKETLIKIAQLMKRANEDNTNDKSDDGDGLDKVQPKAVKKKFKDRKDKDIDNDGDVDSSDKYLHKRRKAVSKAIKSECTSEKDFKPHSMYDPKTGKAFKANTYDDHLKYDKMGYVHDKPKVKKEGLTPRLSAMIDSCGVISDKETFVEEFKLTEDSKYSQIYKAIKLHNK
tara:strand:+ start:3526 stop:4938 length:1413 start_codon:yes stop_codon:yes gene_type:complete